MNSNQISLPKLEIMNIKNKNFLLKSFFLLFIFLLFLKIDFRFEDGIFCCGDDYDYFSHSQTIAEDFDLDYSNQLKGFEDKRYNLNGKVAPKGFFGSGLLASPFLFLGNLVESFFENTDISNNFLSYSLLVYSLSSIFYMFVTVYLIRKCLIKLKSTVSIFETLLIYSASGVAYFAFERFSMSHIYETFAVTLIIYASINYYTNEKNNLYAFFIPLTILLSLLVRQVNYYSLILPVIISYLIHKKFDSSLYKNNYFIFSSSICVLVYCLLSVGIYGIVTINPQTMYGISGMMGGFYKDHTILSFVIENIQNSLKILFGQEFGIFWFSPIIFFGLVSSLFLSKNFSPLNYLIFLSPFILLFGSVLLWKSTASSYGFRYLYSLVPISIVYFYSNYEKKNFNFYRRLLIALSFFSLFSILFFETTILTQLSTTEELNSFGRNIKYVEPNYLSGYLSSIFVVSSYFKIFLTSFLGVIIFKLIFLFIEPNQFTNLLESLNLPVQNEDFQQYIIELQKVAFHKVFVIVAFLFICSYYLVKSDFKYFKN